MKAADWDARYQESDLVWSGEPNCWVEHIVRPLPPGRALDLAAGEGRNALWLVERGWEVHASDFSPVAVRRIEALADARLGSRRRWLSTEAADATESASVTGCDLVVLSYLHLPKTQWRAALACAVAALKPEGILLVVAHARRNLTEGIGGPQDPDILYDPRDIVAELEEHPVEIVSADLRYRTVVTEGGDRQALDTVVVARALSHKAVSVA